MILSVCRYADSYTECLSTELVTMLKGISF